jgi:methanogenic corrinoid protein MtbC1
MSNVSQTEARGGRPLPGDNVDRLAATVLSYVACRQTGKARGIPAGHLHDLQEAVTAGSTGDALATIRRMVRDGIAAEEIADLYVPAVARQLGDMWCTDRIGFATVTIGVARLQGLLRELEAMATVRRRVGRGGASLLVLVAEGIDHTLGAMVLSGQLRRAGHGVRLILGAAPEAVTEALGATLFEAVLISAPEGTRAERLRPLVRAVRAGDRPRVPVVIGGTILDQMRRAGTDILALTGADHATSDIAEALRLCGLAAESRGRTEAVPGC